MPISPSPENVLPASADTLLVIEGLGGFQYQARGLTQTLMVISQLKQQVRTVNGTLIDISNPAFRKYASKITCTDVDAPPLDNLWPGMTVNVYCAASLAYLNGNSGSPYKPIVSGSEYTQGNYTFYRPILQMMVMDVQHTFDEWKADNGWELDLEEV
jgi:hypothetical protein